MKIFSEEKKLREFVICGPSFNEMKFLRLKGNVARGKLELRDKGKAVETQILTKYNRLFLLKFFRIHITIESKNYNIGWVSMYVDIICMAILT